LVSDFDEIVAKYFDVRRPPSRSPRGVGCRKK
jgi:hypothetical protein